MSDRADFLARTLIARLTALQVSLAEEGRRELDRTQRLATIEKILAVELGVTDGAVQSAVEAAAPSLQAVRQAPERETAALADFLRQRLAAFLVES
jgi:primosomal protein N''